MITQLPDDGTKVDAWGALITKSMLHSPRGQDRYSTQSQLSGH